MKLTNYWKIVLVVLIVGPPIINGQSKVSWALKHIKSFVSGQNKISGTLGKVTSYVGKYWELGIITGVVGSIVFSERVTEVILLNLSDKDFVLRDMKCDEGIFDIEKMPPVHLNRSTRVAYKIGSNSILVVYPVRLST